MDNRDEIMEMPVEPRHVVEGRDGYEQVAPVGPDNVLDVALLVARPRVGEAVVEKLLTRKPKLVTVTIVTYIQQ